jgi:chorismate dehydratase
LSQLNGARIAVPESSASSVSLLLLLLKELFGATPELVPVSKPEIADPDIDAALIFGDQALLVEGVWDKKLVKADLGEWWRINTGLPMVFGLWAANAQWASANRELFQGISQSLREARTRGLTTLFSAVVEEGVRRTGLSYERIRRYYTTDLNYEMTARHKLALEEYGKLCRKHGILRPVGKPVV